MKRVKKINKIDEIIKDYQTIGISGHIKPDGDCVGSCLALYNYILENYPDRTVDIRLMPVPEHFLFMKHADQMIHETTEDKKYDLFFCLDCGDEKRLGENAKYFQSANATAVIDHHISNIGFADDNVIVPDASSTCEVLYDLFDDEKISKTIAECLYTGIVHDTGVFNFSCTSSKTMNIAGKLMDKGINFQKIITDTFYKKSYNQNQILGRALLESLLVLDGKCIVSVVNLEEMEFFGVTGKDLDGIIDQLRITEGVECAVFIYQLGDLSYKVSMRSDSYVDVSKIAVTFGGGGHIRAAGCSMEGTEHDVINNIVKEIAAQLQEN